MINKPTNLDTNDAKDNIGNLLREILSDLDTEVTDTKAKIDIYNKTMKKIRKACNLINCDSKLSEEEKKELTDKLDSIVGKLIILKTQYSAALTMEWATKAKHSNIFDTGYKIQE